MSRHGRAGEGGGGYRSRDSARVDRLWRLIDAGVAISKELDLDAVLRRIVVTACEVVGTRYGALGVIDGAGEGLSNFVFHGISPEQADRIGHLPEGRGLLGALITDPHPIRLERLQDDPRSAGFPDEHPPMTSFLGVPVVSRGRVFGNLYLTEKEGGPFTAEDEQLAIALAGQAGVAIENARLYSQARDNEASSRQRLQELVTVQEIGNALLRELDPARVLRMITFRARDLVGADASLIAMVEEGSDEFEVRVAAGRGSTEVSGARFKIKNSLSGRALESGTVEVVQDALEDDRTHMPIARALGARSAIFAPLEDRGQGVGVLAVTHTEAGRFGENELFLMRSFADLASLALRNARLLTEETERVRVEAELETILVREEMRTELLRRVIRAQEDERRRISRDLHDSAGQAFTSILLGLKVVEQEKTLPEARARIADLREIAAEAAGELRRLALELRPTVLDDLGLEAALERYLREFGSRSGIKVIPSLELGERRLHPEVETVVYRVVQEALTNAAKYSDASTVSIRLTESSGSVRVRVRDDGRGFVVADEEESGLGLRGMHERADLVGGKLRVASAPGEGTTVELVIPDAGTED